MTTSPAPGREGHHGAAAIGRSNSVRPMDLSHPRPVPDVLQNEAATRDTNDLQNVFTS